MNNILKFGRWLRRMSARHLISTLPGVAGRYQRFRYRNWVKHLDRDWRISAPRPNFIIIGAPKCGTSWLLAALKQHPNIWMAPKEIEYFSFHLDYPFEWYLEHFARLRESLHCDESKSCILGEKSARYCAIPQAHIQRMRELLPDVRLVLMARDPIARHWAHAKRHFGKRQFNNAEMAVLDVPRDRLLAFFHETRPLSEFSKMVGNWNSIFPPPQLLVISQESTLRSPRITFDAVLKHIGAPTDYDPESITYLSKQRNQGPRVEMPVDVAEFLEDLLVQEREWLQAFFARSGAGTAKNSAGEHSISCALAEPEVISSLLKG